jgi:hypothetical protein
MGTASELREQAAACRAEAAASFERCDTDGFLSQWASGITARLKDTQAEIAEAGGTALFARTALVTLEGAAVEAKVCQTRYGEKWLTGAGEWIPTGSSAKALARRGYRTTEIVERAAAGAAIAASGTGLSGAASAYVTVFRQGAKAAEGWRCVGIAGDERSS